MAETARDVVLRNARLEPWQEKAYLYPVEPGTLSFFMTGCCLYTWPACVQATAYLPDYARLFLTGRTDRAEVTPLANCGAQYMYLGVPAPVSGPAVQGAEAYGENCDARSYVYTYVNGYGEESAPSPPSRQLTVRDGAAVTVSGFAAPPDGWGIIGIALYRSATGARVEEELSVQALQTHYFRVASGPELTGYTDAVLMRNLGIVLDTFDSRPPPRGLRHISHLTDTGILAGVTGSQVHFSENFQPWNWPAKYDLTLPCNIVNMGALDARVFVSTDARPFVIDASNFCEPDSAKAVGSADLALPDISCGQPHSAVITPFGFVYSSADGLILLKPDASWQILTAPWFGSSDWRKLRPDTVRLAFWEGCLFICTEAESFVLNIDTGLYGDSETGQLTTVTDRPSDMSVTAAGELIMLENGAVWQWNAGESVRPFFWTSNPIELSGETSFNVLKVKSEGVMARIQAGGREAEFSRYVGGEKPVRLGRIGRHTSYRISLAGTNPVDYLELATMMTTLRAGV
jgi:hypothetical protein